MGNTCCGSGRSHATHDPKVESKGKPDHIPDLSKLSRISSLTNGYFVAQRHPRDDCIFCQIIKGSSRPDTRVIYQNERLVAFHDIAPAAKAHLLVLPKQHIANTLSVVPADTPLLEEMDSVGRRLLAELHPGEDPSNIKLGYHMPPFRSVDHLHLHCFVLPHTSTIVSLKYKLPGVWITSQDLIQDLRSRATGEDRLRPAGAGLISSYHPPDPVPMPAHLEEAEQEQAYSYSQHASSKQQ